jgi:hypothetical protein
MPRVCHPPWPGQEGEVGRKCNPQEGDKFLGHDVKIARWEEELDRALNAGLEIHGGPRMCWEKRLLVHKWQD